jgi:hypothetical protein
MMATYEELMARDEMQRKATEIIRRHADEALGAHGFRFNTGRPRFGLGQAQYLRTRKGEWQAIDFGTTTHVLVLTFVTRDGGYLYTRDYAPGLESQWEFGSLEELNRLCPEVVAFALHHGLEMIELDQAKPRLPDWREEAKDFEPLGSDSERLAAAFREEHGIPDVVRFSDIRRVDQMLLDCAGQSYEETKGFLLQVAAFVGETLRRQLGGEWAYNKNLLCWCIVFGDPENARDEGRRTLVVSWVTSAWHASEKRCNDLTSLFDSAIMSATRAKQQAYTQSPDASTP